VELFIERRGDEKPNIQNDHRPIRAGAQFAHPIEICHGW